jgi:hypothetical protein
MKLKLQDEDFALKKQELLNAEKLRIRLPVCHAFLSVRVHWSVGLRQLVVAQEHCPVSVWVPSGAAPRSPAGIHQSCSSACLFVFPGSQVLIRGAPVDAPTRAPRVHATRAPQRRGTLVVRHVARSESKCRCAPAVLVLRVARRRRMMIVESLFLAVAFVGVANSARATRCIPLLQSSPLVFAQCFCRQICFPAPCWRGWVASSALGSQTSQLRAFKQAWLKRWGARCDGKTCRVSMRLARETTYFLVRKVCGLWRVCVCVCACGVWIVVACG